jgi:hypothetical protein
MVEQEVNYPNRCLLFLVVIPKNYDWNPLIIKNL